MSTGRIAAAASTVMTMAIITMITAITIMVTA
jgi:hypothetical protein